MLAIFHFVLLLHLIDILDENVWDACMGPVMALKAFLFLISYHVAYSLFAVVHHTNKAVAYNRTQICMLHYIKTILNRIDYRTHSLCGINSVDSGW